MFQYRSNNVIITKEGPMNKLWKYWLGLFVFFLATTSAFAIATAPGVNTGNNNFLGGIVRGQITKDFPYHTGGSFGFEAGPRNYRASGTLGWEATPCQRLKLTGEYLTQDIDYNFYSGVSRQWVQQGAVGLTYQYALNDQFQDYLSLSGFYSHAPSKNLSTITGSFATSATTATTWTDFRRIAGSNAGGVSPAITTHLWQGNETSLAANWDDVVYDNRNQPQKKAQGFGGTASISQDFKIYCENFKIGGSAAARAPFNHYEGELDWVKPFSTSSLLVGVFGGYTQGKYSLPNTGIAGVNVAYYIDTPAQTPPIAKAQSFLSWMGEPAVRLPQVLAIVDENVVQAPGCRFATPTFTSTIANQSSEASSTQTFNSPTHFTGTNLTYTAVTSSVTGGGTSTVTINPTTGVVTVTGLRSTSTITITATNPCGVAVSSNAFTATFD